MRAGCKMRPVTSSWMAGRNHPRSRTRRALSSLNVEVVRYCYQRVRSCVLGGLSVNTYVTMVAERVFPFAQRRGALGR